MNIMAGSTTAFLLALSGNPEYAAGQQRLLEQLSRTDLQAVIAGYLDDHMLEVELKAVASLLLDLKAKRDAVAAGTGKGAASEEAEPKTKQDVIDLSLDEEPKEIGPVSERRQDGSNPSLEEAAEKNSLLGEMVESSRNRPRQSTEAPSLQSPGTHVADIAKVLRVAYEGGEGTWKALHDFLTELSRNLQRKFDTDWSSNEHQVKKLRSLWHIPERYIKQESCMARMVRSVKGPCTYSKANRNKSRTCDACLAKDRICVKL
jgi:hypothetical protein